MGADGWPVRPQGRPGAPGSAGGRAGVLQVAWGCAGAPLPACGAESTLRFLEAGGTLPTDTWSSLLTSRTPRLPLFILPHAALILSKRGPRARPFLPSTSTTSPGLCPSGGPHGPRQDPGLCGVPLLQEAHRAEEKWGRGERGPSCARLGTCRTTGPCAGRLFPAFPHSPRLCPPLPPSPPALSQLTAGPPPCPAALVPPVVSF